jgi:hypothetical protein
MVLGLPVWIRSDPQSEVWIRILTLPFSHKGVERAERLLAIKCFYPRIVGKNKIFMTKDNVPAVSYIYAS